MLFDVALLLRLKARHAWSSLCRLMHFAGADPSVDKGASDKLYYLYIAVVVAAFAAVIGAYASSVAVPLIAQIKMASGDPMRLILVALVVLAGMLCLVALRRTPLKIDDADVAYIVSGPLRLDAVAVVWLAPRLILSALVGAVLGVLVAMGLEAASASVDYCGMVLFLAFSAMCVTTAPWAVGSSMLLWKSKRVRGKTHGGRGRRAVELVLVSAFIFAAFSAAVAALVGAPSAFFEAVCSLPAALVALAVLMVEVALVVVFCGSVSAAVLIQESALNIEMSRCSSMYSAAASSDRRMYRRRCKVSMRRPWLHLPSGQGSLALVGRSALSLIRQPEGLLDLLYSGIFVVPFGVLAFSGAGGVGLLLLWTVVAAMSAGNVKEVGRVFLDDMRLRSMRDRLPFGTGKILVCDMLVFAVVVAIAGVTVSAGISAAAMRGVSDAGGLASGTLSGLANVSLFGLHLDISELLDPCSAALAAVALTTMLVLCCAWDAIVLPRQRSVASFEQALVLAVAAAFVFLAAGAPAPVGIAGGCVLLALGVWRGREV